MNTYPITNKRKLNELQTIRTTLSNNHYPPQATHITQTKDNNDTQSIKQKKKWALFTYLVRETTLTTFSQ
jgi:hypothetical protein